MIAHIAGQVDEKFAGSVIIDVQGVGYEIAVAAHDYDAIQLGEVVKLYPRASARAVWLFVTGSQEAI